MDHIFPTRHKFD
uniref:Uncharacterized protein n=1 Tax=Anguilla anguilla TaxID=7936 RepID=A0A0E9PD45_ANGAN